MPTISIFIRKDDLPKWQALENKSEFLHNALREQPDTYLLSPKLAKENPDLVKQFDKAAETFVPKAPDPETGYPCCQAKRPCKHWHYDGNEAVWRNELTGATREVT